MANNENEGSVFLLMILLGIIGFGVLVYFGVEHGYVACVAGGCIAAACIYGLAQLRAGPDLGAQIQAALGGSPRTAIWVALCASVVFGLAGLFGGLNQSAARARELEKTRAAQDAAAQKAKLKITRLGDLAALPTTAPVPQVLSACVALGDWWSELPADVMGRCDSARVTLLPPDRVQASQVLGGDRATVRRMLGKVKSTADLGLFLTDTHQRPGGLAIDVAYQKGVAVRIQVRFRGADKDARIWRVWLGVAPDGPLTSPSGKPWRVETGDGWLSIADEDFAQAVAGFKRAAELLVSAGAAKKAEQKLRADLASNLEQAFLDAGIDAHVAARGTTLVINYTLCSRPFVNQLANDNDGFLKVGLSTQIQAVGFKQIDCYGYDAMNRVTF